MLFAPACRIFYLTMMWADHWQDLSQLLPQADLGQREHHGYKVQSLFDHAAIPSCEHHFPDRFGERVSQIHAASPNPSPVGNRPTISPQLAQRCISRFPVSEDFPGAIQTKPRSRQAVLTVMVEFRRCYRPPGFRSILRTTPPFVWRV